MISLKKHSKGFTIVELLIVIVVIGILALLVITTYSGIQQKARNSKRQTDIASVQTQLEAFFSQQGYYPSYKDLSNTTTATWDKDNLPSMDINALIDPKSGASAPTLANSNNAAAPGVPNKYQYYPTDSSGSSANCEATDTTCAKYTLITTFEGSVNGQPTASKSNLD